MASVFTSGQRDRLLAIEGVSAVGGTNKRIVFLTVDTPEIRQKVHDAVGSHRYTIQVMGQVVALKPVRAVRGES